MVGNKLSTRISAKMVVLSFFIPNACILYNGIMFVLTTLVPLHTSLFYNLTPSKK